MGMEVGKREAGRKNAPSLAYSAGRWLGGDGCSSIALKLICLGIICFGLVWLMAHGHIPDNTILGMSFLVISASSLFLGVGYFLFKLFLVGVSETATAVRKGSAEAPPPPAQDTTPSDDLKTRLRTLEDLRNDGLLTDAEYQAKREEILGEV